MLYLIRPTGDVQWENVPGKAFLEAAREHPQVDLAKLDWQPAERQFTDDTIRVGLRHGVPCSAGIVVEAIHLIDLTRADELRSTHAQAKDAREALRPHEQLMEHLIPGWIEEGKKLDLRIDEGAEKAALEAEDEAAEILRAPVDQALLEHWRSLGGRVPNPA